MIIFMIVIFCINAALVLYLFAKEWQRMEARHNKRLADLERIHARQREALAKYRQEAHEYLSKN